MSSVGASEEEGERHQRLNPLESRERNFAWEYAEGLIIRTSRQYSLRHSSLESPLYLCLDMSQEISAFPGYSRAIQMIKRAKRILLAMGYKLVRNA